MLRKARQHNTTEIHKTICPRQLFLKLSRVGLEPTTVRLLGDALTNCIEAAQLAGLKLHIQSNQSTSTKEGNLNIV